MVFRQRSTCNETVVSFKIFDEFDQKEHLPPKLDMPINAKSNDHISFGRDYNIIDSIAMHVADLIILRSGDVLQ